MGVDLSHPLEASLRPLVEEGLNAPLPAGWEAHVSDDGQVLFML